MRVQISSQSAAVCGGWEGIEDDIACVSTRYVLN
jgi:hypothetical protein